MNEWSEAKIMRIFGNKDKIVGRNDKILGRGDIRICPSHFLDESGEW